MDSPTPVLEYSAGATHRLKPMKRRWVWIVLAIPSLVVPFVPFACDVSPMDALGKAATQPGTFEPSAVMVTALAFGLIAGVAPLLWRVRLRFKRPTSTKERTLALLMGALMFTCAIVVLSVGVGDKPSSLKEWPVWLSSALAIFCITSFFVLRSRWHPDDASLAALMGGYISVGTLAILLFTDFAWRELGLGWKLTVECVAVSWIEYLLMSVTAMRLRWS